MLSKAKRAEFWAETARAINPDDSGSLINGLTKALRQPMEIPAGLNYFSYDAFCGRLRAALEPMMVRAL